MKIAAIIPARYASSRFPGKPLADLAGKSLIQRVYERVSDFPWTFLTIATDHDAIFQHVKAFGGQVQMTQSHHQTGTDRCAEVAKDWPNIDLVVNIQGDEPFIQLSDIQLLVDLFDQHPSTQIATLAKRIRQTSDLFNPNVVKVVLKANQQAAYFSRQAIPYQRDLPQQAWLDGSQAYFRHIGLYAFRRETLLRVAALPPSSLEQSEVLEQLRWLEQGYTISVGETTHESFGIDQPEDVAKALQRLNEQSKP